MQSKIKKEQEKFPDVNRQGWNVEDVSEEAANKSPDETLRQVLRGDESKGNADERDVVGSADNNETPQGREEAKKNQGVI